MICSDFDYWSAWDGRINSLMGALGVFSWHGSILTVIAISLNRYTAFAQPLLYQQVAFASTLAW